MVLPLESKGGGRDVHGPLSGVHHGKSNPARVAISKSRKVSEAVDINPSLITIITSSPFKMTASIDKGESSTAATKAALAVPNGPPNYELPWYVQLASRYHPIIADPFSLGWKSTVQFTSMMSSATQKQSNA